MTGTRLPRGTRGFLTPAGRFKRRRKGMKKSWVALLITVGAVMLIIVGLIVYARVLIGAPMI